MQVCIRWAHSCGQHMSILGSLRMRSILLRAETFTNLFSCNILQDPDSGLMGLTMVMAHQHQNCHVQQFARAAMFRWRKKLGKTLLQHALQSYCVTMFVTSHVRSVNKVCQQPSNLNQISTQSTRRAVAHVPLLHTFQCLGSWRSGLMRACSGRRTRAFQLWLVLAIASSRSQDVSKEMFRYCNIMKPDRV